jgi:hypothetical protein
MVSSSNDKQNAGLSYAARGKLGKCREQVFHAIGKIMPRGDMPGGVRY